MRIVAGTARGRRLLVPEGHRTRPTSERVREATFNALFSLGAIEAATMCDLFAGSGALGLEALSRGAERVAFVERDRAALAALRRNVDTLGFSGRAAVVAADVMRWLTTAPRFDVVLADPPYDFDQWDTLLARARGDLLVAESDRPIPPGDRWRIVRERSYGTTVVTIMEAAASDPGPDPGPDPVRAPTAAPEESPS